MSIRNISGTIVKDDNIPNPVDCPVCAHNVVMTLLTDRNNPLISAFKKLPNENTLAFCPYCESFFSVNENFIKERDNGTTVSMTKEDLKVIVKGKKCDTL